jgi:hypothetical protein
VVKVNAFGLVVLGWGVCFDSVNDDNFLQGE